MSLERDVVTFDGELAIAFLVVRAVGYIHDVNLLWIS